VSPSIYACVSLPAHACLDQLENAMFSALSPAERGALRGLVLRVLAPTNDTPLIAHDGVGELVAVVGAGRGHGG
jgi:hypothetical protein